MLKKENSKLRNCPLLFIPTLLLHLKTKVCVWKITSFWNFDFFPDPFLERVILAALMILSEAGQPVVRTTLITKWYLWCQLGPLPTTSPRLSLNCFLSLGLPPSPEHVWRCYCVTLHPADTHTTSLSVCRPANILYPTFYTQNSENDYIYNRKIIPTCVRRPHHLQPDCQSASHRREECFLRDHLNSNKSKQEGVELLCTARRSIRCRNKLIAKKFILTSFLFRKLQM